MSFRQPLHIIRSDRAGVHCGRPVTAGRAVTEEQSDTTTRRVCQQCVRRFLVSLDERGFLLTARFEAREFPKAIWIGDEVITGPFCQHCGNPSYVHGPGFRCRNHRIHPCLPMGDLRVRR